MSVVQQEYQRIKSDLRKIEARIDRLHEWAGDTGTGGLRVGDICRRLRRRLEDTAQNVDAVYMRRRNVPDNLKQTLDREVTELKIVSEVVLARWAPSRMGRESRA